MQLVWEQILLSCVYTANGANPMLPHSQLSAQASCRAWETVIQPMILMSRKKIE